MPTRIGRLIKKLKRGQRIHVAGPCVITPLKRRTGNRQVVQIEADVQHKIEVLDAFPLAISESVRDSKSSRG